MLGLTLALLVSAFANKEIETSELIIIFTNKLIKLVWVSANKLIKLLYFNKLWIKNFQKKTDIRVNTTYPRN